MDSSLGTLITTTITVSTPPQFGFWRTVYSHGWCALPPFRVDKKEETLDCVFSLSDGTLAVASLRSLGQDKISATITSQSPFSAPRKKELTQLVRSILRLDEDFSDFYRHVSRYPDYRWICRMRVGRLLRAPTVFEDVVKMMCTTNCSWALTTTIVTNLTSLLGPAADAGLHGFPAAASIAGQTDAFIRKYLRAGYRAPYLLELSDRVASGKLDLESWRTSAASTEELFRQVRGVKGIGEYAAGNILKLLGRYDYLGLDSWVRGKYSEKYHSGRRVSDTTIERRYREHGQWRGLIIWLEMTRDWFTKKFPF